MSGAVAFTILQQFDINERVISSRQWQCSCVSVPEGFVSIVNAIHIAVRLRVR